jgi:SAM-dependent methyltransferase
MAALSRGVQGGEQHVDGKLDGERYEQAWRELMASSAVPPHAYLTYHKERFYELFDHLALYLRGNPSPRVLEIGVSDFTKLYKVLFPHIQLVTVDRPVALYGFDATFTRGECGADHHYNIDLNREPIGPDYGEPPLDTFDYVILSEVLEHLIVNPIQLFGELLSLLAPNGLLYLTTPNFFSLFHLRQLAEWDNPQLVFPRRGQDRDAGFHFREYTMLELIDFFEQAGGAIVKAHFSDCWDDPSVRAQLDRTPQLRSDLMVVISRRDAEITHEGGTSQLRKFVKPTPDQSIPSNLLQLQEEIERLRQIVQGYESGRFQEEIERLRQIVQGYESGRFMCLMKWLHERGVPHF